MLKPSNYIQSQLDSLRDEGRVDVPQDGLVDAIIGKVLSKKFRKYKVDEAFTDHVHRVVASAIAENKPITMVWVFGGYKLWRIPTTPSVDWGELFSMIYFAKYAKSIAGIYEPGVVFDFYSDDVIVSRIDNVPEVDIEEYLASFKELLAFIGRYLPKNVKFTFNRVGDQYNGNEFDLELTANIAKLETSLPNGLPEMNEVKNSLVELNVKLKPDQDKDPQWRARVMLIHDAYSAASKRRPYYRNDHKLMVVNTALPCTVAIGTTKSSVAKFWCGMGVLEQRGDSYYEKILTPKQLDVAEVKMEPVVIEGLSGENFKAIGVIKQ